jgi:hypothetical protein
MTQSMDKIKWAGWVILGAVAFSFCGWISGEVVANGKAIAVIEERQHSQYEQLRDDIAELKRLIAGQ